MRDQVAGHAQFAGVHVVNAELQGLVVKVMVDLVHTMISGRLVYVVRQVVRMMEMMMMMMRVVVQNGVQLGIVMVVAVAKEVAQIVRQAEEQLRVSGVLVPTMGGAFQVPL